MQSTITCDDVLASHEKFGHVLEYDLRQVNNLQDANPKAQDVTYIQVVFKHVNGKKIPRPKFKFSEQIISSGAKVPSTDDTQTPKYMSISFTTMKKEDIEGGDYVPKVKETDELQDKENERMAQNIKRYESNNETWIKVLNIIENSYRHLCDDLIAKADTLKFQVQKNRKQKDITICSFKYGTRYDKTLKEDVELENPIFRLKLGVYKEDGRIGYYSTYYKKFQYIVYNARKMTKKNNYADVVAKVKVDGKHRDLDVSNAGTFITRKSLVEGTWQLNSICASKAGLSPDNKFYNLYVYSYKSKDSQETTTKADIMRMHGGDEEEEEEDSGVDEEVTENKTSDKAPSVVPHDSDDDESDEEKGSVLDVVTEETPEVVADEQPSIVSDETEPPEVEDEPAAKPKRGRKAVKK